MGKRLSTITSASGETLPLVSCLCERCGHEWRADVVNPKQCPQCKATTWDIPFNEMRSQINKITRETQNKLNNN